VARREREILERAVHAVYLTMAEGIRLTAQSFSTDVEMLSCCAA
jgi:hypothetical protein